MVIMAEDEKDTRPEQREGDQKVGKEQDAEATEQQEQDEGEGDWQPVRKSSNVEAYKYNKTTKELTVMFKGGRTHSYSGISQDVAEGLGTASSPGSYVWKHFR